MKRTKKERPLSAEIASMANAVVRGTPAGSVSLCAVSMCVKKMEGRIEALQRLCGYAQHHHTCPAALDHFEPDGNEPAPCSCGLAELREAEKGTK